MNKHYIVKSAFLGLATTDKDIKSNIYEAIDYILDIYKKVYDSTLNPKTNELFCEMYIQEVNDSECGSRSNKIKITPKILLNITGKLHIEDFCKEDLLRICDYVKTNISYEKDTLSSQIM